MTGRLVTLAVSVGLGNRRSHRSAVRPAGPAQKRAGIMETMLYTTLLFKSDSFYNISEILVYCIGLL